MEKDFARIIQLLEEISRKLDKPQFTPSSVCSLCGVNFNGLTGYACPRSDCPVQGRAVS